MRKFLYLWTLLALSLLFLEVHYLNARYNFRYDLSESRLYTLSKGTKQLLASLKVPPKFVVLLPKGHPDRQLLMDLLEEYAKIRPDIEIEELNLFQNPQQLEKYRHLYRKLRRNTALIVVLGKREKYFSLQDLRRGRTFRAEEAITNGLASLRRHSRPLLFFSQGHGEGSLSSTLPLGLSRLAGLLERENYEIRSGLLRPQSLHSAQVALLIGPREKLLDEEEATLSKYLQKGGKVVVCLDPESATPLKKLLREYGILPKSRAITEPKEQRWRDPQYVVVRHFSEHPATRPLQGYSSAHPGILPFEIQSRPKVRHWRLLLSSREAKLPNSPLQPPFPLAVWAERDKSRLVVFGDSHFLRNGTWRGDTPLWGIDVAANADLFLNVLSELVGEKHLVRVGEKQIREHRLDIGALELRRIWWFCCILLPSLSLFLGLTVWLFRRDRTK